MRASSVRNGASGRASASVTATSSAIRTTANTIRVAQKSGMKNASSCESSAGVVADSPRTLARGGGINVVRGVRSSGGCSIAPVFDIRRRLGTGFGDRRVVEILFLANGVGAEEPARQRVALLGLARDLAILLALGLQLR